METEDSSDIKFFDYGKSFIIIEGKGDNTPRFQIEAKCTIDNEITYNDYYLCASCGGENTFAETHLFETNRPFKFIPIFGDKQVMILRSFKYFLEEEIEAYRRIYEINKLWTGKIGFIKEVYTRELLDTSQKIRFVVKEGKRMMARICFRENSLNATLDFPIKTINICKDKWQVDTGLVLFPDMEQIRLNEIIHLNPAYVAFNNFEFADFLIKDLMEINTQQKISFPHKPITIVKPDIKLYSL